MRQKDPWIRRILAIALVLSLIGTGVSAFFANWPATIICFVLVIVMILFVFVEG